MATASGTVPSCIQQQQQQQKDSLLLHERKDGECLVSSSSQHQQSVVSSSTPSIVAATINNNQSGCNSSGGGSVNCSPDITGGSSISDKILGGGGAAAATQVCICATVSFMDIKSAAKAHHAEHKLDDKVLTTEYYEPSSVGVTGGSSIIAMSTSNYKHSSKMNNNSVPLTANTITNGPVPYNSSQGLGPVVAASTYSSNVPGISSSRFLSSHGLVFCPLL